MGAGESKDSIKELNLFPAEERQILGDNFKTLSQGKTSIERRDIEVIYNLYCQVEISLHSNVFGKECH